MLTNVGQIAHCPLPMLIVNTIYLLFLLAEIWGARSH